MQCLDQARASSSSFLLNTTATATSPVNSPSPQHISAGRLSGTPFLPQRQCRAPIFFSALPPAQRHVATYVSQKSLPLVLSTNSLFPAACLTPHIMPAVPHPDNKPPLPRCRLFISAFTIPSYAAPTPTQPSGVKSSECCHPDTTE